MKMTTRKRAIATSAKRLREEDALDELQANHRYCFFELAKKSERSTLIVSSRRKSMKFCNAVAIKLVVPESSALGKRILKMRKERATAKAKRPGAKRAIDHALGRKPSESRSSGKKP